MSGIPTASAPIAAGSPAADSAIDRRCVIIGRSSLGSGVSTFMRSSPDLIAARGYGNPVDTACGVIEQKLDGGGAGIKYPVALCQVPATNPGSYGAIDVTGITGTVTAAVDATSLPFGTYEARLLVNDGGILGTAGITVKWSLNGGRLYSNPVALGVATSYTIPNSGVKIDFGPTGTNAAFVALAVEMRADTLAHLANVTAHDAADTSAAQVALAASSPPTTTAQAWVIVNLCCDALESHETDLSAHNGPDPVNVVTAPVATNVKTGIDRAVQYKTKFNDHLGIALAGSASGLLAATATTVALQTPTAPTMISGGVSALDLYPRRLVFTTAGSPASDAPATANITGFDSDVSAQSENAFAIAQTATTATTTKAFRGTGLSVAYAAGDGTGATVAIGYGMGVHNSADVTNVLTATSPTYGTLVAGDVVKVRTIEPTPSAADIFDASTTPPTGALATLALSPQTFAMIACDFPVNAAMAAVIKTGLDYMESKGKPVVCINRVRLPDAEASETETAWSASVKADFLNFYDYRQVQHAGYGRVTDAVTGRVYQRSTFAQLIADVIRCDLDAWPDRPEDRPRAGVRLSDEDGIDVGHDEGERGTATGLASDELGSRFSTDFRDSKAANPESVYGGVPFTCYGPTDTIKNLMVARVVFAIRRVALQAIFRALGGKIAYEPADPTVFGSVPTLPEATRLSLQGVVLAAIASQFGTMIQNATDADIDTGLVQIPTVATVTSGNLVTIQGALSIKVFGYLIGVSMPISIQE